MRSRKKLGPRLRTVGIDLWNLFAQWFPSKFLRFAIMSVKPDVSDLATLSRKPKVLSVRGVASDWNEGMVLYGRGYYHHGVSMMVEAIEKSYALFGLDPRSSAPPIMSPAYASHIGHLALLSRFLRAQDLGIVQQNRRILLPTRLGNEQVFSGLANRVGWIPARDSAFREALRQGSKPSLWPLIERLEVVNAFGTFTEIYALWERVWQESKLRGATAGTIHLEESYVQEAERQIHLLGLAPGQPFVALHIRSLPEQYQDERAPKVETYFDAIRFVVRQGFAVVRFGQDQKPFPEMEGVIDVATLQGKPSFLDAWIIDKSSFMISTNSGPAYLASELGTPVLHTNTIAIGRQALSGPAGTLYLPKRYFHRNTGEELMLSDLLASPIGYLENFHASGAFLPRGEWNSSEEIRQATEEMIEFVSRGSEPGEGNRRSVDKIRSASGAIGYGTIANSFIEARPSWLS